MSQRLLLKCEWTQCQHEFTDLIHLVNHLRDVHIGFKKSGEYCCEWNQCSRKGIPQASRFSLIAHMRSHTGERPYDCPVAECDKSFTRSDALAKHQKQQHRIDPKQDTEGEDEMDELLEEEEHPPVKRAKQVTKRKRRTRLESSVEPTEADVDKRGNDDDDDDDGGLDDAEGEEETKAVDEETKDTLRVYPPEKSRTRKKVKEDPGLKKEPGGFHEDEMEVLQLKYQYIQEELNHNRLQIQLYFQELQALVCARNSMLDSILHHKSKAQPHLPMTSSLPHSITKEKSYSGTHKRGERKTK